MVSGLFEMCRREGFTGLLSHSSWIGLIPSRHFRRLGTTLVHILPARHLMVQISTSLTYVYDVYLQVPRLFNPSLATHPNILDKTNTA